MEGQSRPTSVNAGGDPVFLKSSGGVNPPCGEILPSAKCSDGAKAPGRCRALRTAPIKNSRPSWGDCFALSYSSAIALAAAIAFSWAMGGQSS